MATSLPIGGKIVLVPQAAGSSTITFDGDDMVYGSGRLGPQTVIPSSITMRKQKVGIGMDFLDDSATASRSFPHSRSGNGVREKASDDYVRIRGELSRDPSYSKTQV